MRAINKAKSKIGNKKSTLNKKNINSIIHSDNEENINTQNHQNIENVKEFSPLISISLDDYTLNKNKINDSKLNRDNHHYLTSNNKDNNNLNFNLDLNNQKLDDDNIICSKNVTSHNLFQENRLDKLNKLSDVSMDKKKKSNILGKPKKVIVKNVKAKKSNIENNANNENTSNTLNSPNYYVDNKHHDYRDNQGGIDDYDSTFYSSNQKPDHQNKLFSEQDNIMNNQISGSEEKEKVVTQSFIATNETSSLSNSLDNGAVTQQNLDLSKDMFDMNASKAVVQIEEISEVSNKISEISNDSKQVITQTITETSSIKVEKMNDDTFLTTESTQVEIQSITEVTHFSEDFNQLGIEKITERKGIRIRSKDTSLSSRYAKEYADMTEEFCCFNYSPPTKSISHFIFQNDLDSLIRHIESQMGNEKFDLNQCDEIGETASWTPLYWAVKLNKIDFVKCLLEKGADVNVVINDYNECCGTALDLAMLRGYDSIELVLKEYMEKEAIKNQKGGFKNIRTKPRGKAPAFNFKYYGKKKRECQFSDDETINTQDFNLNK
jgi:hypothetical protein